MILYHVSKDPNLTELTPKIPKFDDTERVPFTSSIDGCLKSIDPKVGEIYHVYKAIDYNGDEVYIPSTSESMDALYTSKKWIKRNIGVRKIASIVIEDIKDTGRKFILPDNAKIPVLEYKWKYIRVYNENESKADGYLDYIIK